MRIIDFALGLFDHFKKFNFRSFHELAGVPAEGGAVLLDPRFSFLVVADKDGGEVVVDDLPLDVVVVGAFIEMESFRDLGQDPIGRDPLILEVLSNEGFEHWV
ncbi:MAG: hypothetical protein HC924_18935 [Synechococcaceae cyanobacterium SM2_3_2]|nr:hypothetical protein [Synechococcaceae cyanobacterium SM2_3_2]